MDNFTSGAAPNGATFVDGVAWRETDHYREARVELAGTWYPIYVIKVSETTCAAITCWDHYVDTVLAQIEAAPQIQQTARRLYPTIFRTIDNAIAERYGDGACVEFLDPDDVNRKWFIAVLFPASSGHISAFRHATGVAMEKVLAISMHIAVEAANRPSRLDYVKVAALGALQGASRGLARVNQAREHLQWLDPLFDG